MRVEVKKEEVIQKLEGERNKLTENKSVCIKIDDNWTLSDMVNAQRESYYIDSIDYLNLENLKKIELKDLIEGILTNEDLKIINDDLINENGIAHIDEESFLQLNSLDSVIESAEYDIKQRIKYLEESMNED